MVVVDIETVGIDGLDVEPVSAPANYKDPEKIAQYIAEKQAEQVARAALYPWSCRIIALGWCEEQNEVPTVELAGSQLAEGAMLARFWDVMWNRRTNSVERFVTFNGRTFDLPVIMARSRLLGVPAPDLNLDRYRSPNVDLMDELTFKGAIQARSLGWFARRFGLNTDDNFSGKEIAGLLEDGNWDAIKAHCESDVNLTRQLGERIGVLKRRPVAA